MEMGAKYGLQLLAGMRGIIEGEAQGAHQCSGGGGVSTSAAS